MESAEQQFDNLGLNIVPKQTRSKLKKRFRRMCIMVVDKYPIKLSGKGKDSQIDESMFRKSPKNHSGQASVLIDKKCIWVIGAYGPIFGAPEKYGIRMNLEANRKKARCNQLVKDHIAIDTRIKTDEWKGYLDLSSLSGSGITIYIQYCST